MRCKATAVVRYTWPDADEKKACAVHAVAITLVANAVDLRLQLIPLPVELTEQCDHEVAQ